MIESSMMLISSSYVYEQRNQYLGYCKNELQGFLPKSAKMLFIPFAYGAHDAYTQRVQRALREHGTTVTGAHTIDIPDATFIRDHFDVVFCGGGNTFLLLAELYRRELFAPIKRAVEMGVRYMGSSAGANVACPTIGTTNDMPIIEPKSLRAFAFIPFNINPHYWDRPPEFEHMGESRRDRIREFVELNGRPVLAMREGAILIVKKESATLAGSNGSVVFQWNAEAKEMKDSAFQPGENVSFLLSAKGVE